MYSPRHDKEKVGETGQSLAASSRVNEEMAEAADGDASEKYHRVSYALYRRRSGG